MMSVVGAQRAKMCQYRFLEGYTSLLGEGGVEELTRMVGEVEIIRRSAVENPNDILQKAKKTLVALLVIGDPLQATTHTDLILHAIENGINYEVIHAPSVTTIVSGGLGLQNYKFGRQVTLAFPVGDYLPTSPIEMACENFENGLHTLVLLDLDPTGSGEIAPSPMTPLQAVEVIEKSVQKLLDDPPEYLIEELIDKNNLSSLMRLNNILSRIKTPVSEWYAILCSNLGTEQEIIVHGPLSEIKKMDGDGIHCLVIPSNMHEMEKKALFAMHQQI